MLITGTPIAAMPTDPSFKDRFWYWTGASGRKYIHSVYTLEDCPPLPGAIYVAVRRAGPMRLAAAVGRFSAFWDNTLGSRNLDRLRADGIDELHVHLLAKSPEVAAAILEDLQQAAAGEDDTGFAESYPLASMGERRISV
jgi:hypothetical protein